MAIRIRLLAAGVAAVALAGPAAAQVAERTTTTTTTEIRKASVVMNANVVVQDGATVGKITDFVISDNGCIEYVVVGYESKFVLLPYQVLRVDTAQRVVSVNVTRDKFTTIPTFTGTNWPIRDQQYIGRVNTVFGVTESGFRGDPRDADRRPMDRRDDRQDRREDRRDDRRDRRDQPPPQRRDVENPNRPTDRPPADRPPSTRPNDPNRPADRPPAERPPNRDRDRERDPNRTPPPAPPAPPPPPPPSSNPPPA